MKTSVNTLFEYNRMFEQKIRLLEYLDNEGGLVMKN